MSQKKFAYTRTASIYEWEATRGTPSKTTFHVGHFIRWIIFFVLETGFIAFAVFCLFRPIPLGPSRFGTSTVKGGVTTIFIVWHSIASLSASAIISDSFSREWSVSHLGVTDRVSTITSGWLDQIIYSFTPGPTGTFRIAFFTSTLLFVLAHLGPSTITTSSDALQDVVPLYIGNLTSGDSIFPIVKMEQVSKLHIGYTMPPNWIISCPPSIPSSNDTYEYTSDLVHYRHTCQFTMPSIDSSTLEVTVNGVKMFPITVGDPITGNNTVTSAIMSTYPRDETLNSFAIVIFGGNSTIPLDPTGGAPNTIDLSGLPTLYNSNGHAIRTTGKDGSLHAAPLVTSIWCDPHAELTTGVIRLSSNELTVVEHGLPTRVGNIAPNAVPHFFTRGLSDIFSTEGYYQEGGTSASWLLFSTVSAKVVLPDPTTGSSWVGSSAKPLDANAIAKNVDSFTVSASKAVTRALVDSDIILDANATTLVTAKRTKSDLALATSKLYLIVTMILFIVIAILLMFLVVLIRKQERPSFKLKYIACQ